MRTRLFVDQATYDIFVLFVVPLVTLMTRPLPLGAGWTNLSPVTSPLDQYMNIPELRELGVRTPRAPQEVLYTQEGTKYNRGYRIELPKRYCTPKRVPSITEGTVEGTR